MQSSVVFLPDGAVKGTMGSSFLEPNTRCANCDSYDSHKQQDRLKEPKVTTSNPKRYIPMNAKIAFGHPRMPDRITRHSR
jgi:hypothetical protein